MQTLNDQRAFMSESILRLMRRALDAPDLPSAVTPILEELVDRTAAVGSAYFQSDGSVPAYHARAAAGYLPEDEGCISLSWGRKSAMAERIKGEWSVTIAPEGSQRGHPTCTRT